jgi:serine protease inhibitor
MSKINLARIFATIITLAMLPNAFPQTNPVQSLAAGETAFAFDLYGQLKSSQGNLFYSPYSISTCLGMTYVGARGDTARQMAQTLHFGAGPTELSTPMGALHKELNEIQQKKGVELHTANGLWGEAGYPFLKSFVEISQQQFGAMVNQVDFRTEAESARKEINGWVSGQTKNKINDLLAPGVLNAATRLVLVNAIYFKGRWVHQFKQSNTADAPFTLGSGEKVQAHMMNIEEHFKYAETDDLQLLELPYTGGDTDPLSMVVLLPKDVQGLHKLENALTQPALSNWLAQAHDEKVKVFFPKFKMTAEFSLGKTLAAMGMRDAFSTQADFSGIDGKRDLYISAVVHKAYVDVNEEGTEAAAATGVAIRSLAVLRPKNVVFRADHPFIFFIRDNRSGSILFLGRVNDPTK